MVLHLCSAAAGHSNWRFFNPLNRNASLLPGDLEGKVKWLDNYQKVKQLRDALVWLPVWERNKRAFVPEVCLLMYVSVCVCACVYILYTLIFVCESNT